MARKTKAVIFDLDDTLHDLRKYTFTSFSHVACKLGQEIGADPSSLYLSMCQKYDEAWWRSRVFDRVALELGIAEKEELVKRCRGWFHEADHDEGSLFQDALPVLQTLQDKYPIGVLADGRGLLQRKKLTELKIACYFDHVVAVTGAHEKPSPVGFKKICQELKVTFEEALFIGDNPYRDIVGALSMGMKAGWMKGNSVWAYKEVPSQLITKPYYDLFQLIDILRIL